jgi:transposase
VIELQTVSLDELQTLLDEVDEKVPTQRVLTAMGRKLGLSTGTLSTLNDVSEQTIRNWLNRFEDQPIDQAPYDDPRSGRPPKLTDEQKAEFFADLHNSPEDIGYDRQVWFPALVYRHLKETYDIEYSPSQIYRLLHEAGLSWRTARPRHYEADSEAEAEFQETLEKKRRN